MSLQIQYRPKSFKTFVGNEDVIQSLDTILKRENPPVAFLFTGLGGTGKTTLGRIVAKMLGCKKADFNEMNSADDRGIDGIRKIINSLKYTALGGGKKVILLDEAHCFCRNTLISTPKGSKRIDSVKANDVVFNLNGTDIIEKVFINKVTLDNVVRVNKTDGSCTFCSKDHEYYLDGEWIEAKDLTNKLLVKYSEHMINTNSLKGNKNAENLPTMQDGISSSKEDKTVLFEQMFCNLQGILESSSNFRFYNLQNLQSKVYSKVKKTEILFTKLFWKIRKELCKEYYTHNRNKEEDTEITSCFGEIAKGKRDSQKIFKKNEKKQSYEYTRNKRENDSDKKDKRDITYLDWGTWWKWQINRTAKIVNDCIRMGTRSCYKNSRSLAYATTNSMVSKEECSYELQSRCGKQKIENRNRDRRKKSQFKSTKSTGQKENISSKIERVESVEIYQRGSNDRSFSSIIGDKERNQGYVEFYDLQIKENHSYIANNNMVHNCLTKPSQEALLKALEEPPDHVHFIICTTNPETLKQTFKRRCHAYELDSLKDSDLQKLMKRILKKEKRDSISMKVRDKIVELSDGSAGQALKLLDQVIDMDDTDRAITTLKSAGTSESEVISFCRIITNMNMPSKTKWAKIKKLLKNFKGDGESARRPILGYLNSILLNNGGDDVAYMMENFEKNFFDSGKAGLTLACYKSIFGIEE